MKALNPIKLIVLITICISCPRRLAAQTVSWTSSAPTVATVDTNGTVTPLSEGTATITATVEQNGNTLTSSKTVEVSLSPPPITINGVKWATGNVTFDPASCTNGVCTKLAIATDPYDRGLMFQWGGDGAHIIGYPNGGKTTTGSSGNAWNVTPNAADTSTWRYVQPGATFPGSWPANSSGGYNSYGTSQPEWNIVNNPCTLISGGWRMPVLKEGTDLFASANWVYGSTNGGFFQDSVSGIIFPMTGDRSSTNGALFSNQGNSAFYWLSTEYDANNGGRMFFRSGAMQMASYYKALASTIRCVLD